MEINNINFKLVDFENANDIANFREIYNEAFPLEERVSIDEFSSGKYNYLKCRFITIKNEIVGIIVTIEKPSMLYLYYFAIKNILRDLGIGSIVLNKLKSTESRPIVLSAEYSSDPQSNQIQRRFKFYHKNGFEITNLTYLWQGVRLVLVKYGNIDYETYKKEVFDIFDFFDYSL